MECSKSNVRVPVRFRKLPRFSLQTFNLLLVLGWLWFRLIDHLRIEWSVNPQYSYGWAVPFLCVYLACRRMRREAPSACTPSTPCTGPALSGMPLFALGAVALLYFPTRLVEEANPEWRLVSWALALEVITITWLLAGACQEGLKPEVSGQEGSHRAAWGQPWSFPLAFFLIAVPWPTVVEGPLIRTLSYANTAITVGLVNLLGIPALQHANTIEVATGVVGIDEACSGIRSLQAALMVALFLGEFFQLTRPGRWLLVAIGFGGSLVCNLIRTTLLTWLAATKGMAAVGAWHDPAGTGILVGCFTVVWVAGWRMRKTMAAAEVSSCRLQVPRCEHTTKGRGRLVPGAEPYVSINGDEDVPAPLESMNQGLTQADGVGTEVAATLGTAGCRTIRSWGRFKGRMVVRPTVLSFNSLLFLLAGWVLLAEVGTESWYRWHEARLPAPVTWRVSMPTHAPGFQWLGFSERARQFLRFDEGQNARWAVPEAGDSGSSSESVRAQAIFLRWKAGRTAVHLARTHTPESCVTAAGREMESKSAVRYFSVDAGSDAGGKEMRELRLPYRAYTFKDGNGIPDSSHGTAPEGRLRVYYILWEDRGTAGGGIEATELTYGNRLGPVLAGRRLLGQRSLELALWGVAEEEEADRLAKRILKEMVKR